MNDQSADHVPLTDPGRGATGRSGAAGRAIRTQMAGLGLIGGALVGFLVLSAVEYDESADLAAAAAYGAPGLMIGAVLGLVVALLSATALIAVQRRTHASRAVCVAVAAVSAAVVITVIFLLASGFNLNPAAILFCAVVAAVPTGLMAVRLTRPQVRAR